MNETDNPQKSRFKKINSVSFRLPVLFVISITVIVVIFVSILYFRFRTRMIAQYSHIAEGATNLMAVELDGDKVDEYLEKNFELDEYKEIRGRFYNIRDSYPDILYMYVYRLDPEGGTVIFDLDSVDGTEDAGTPGERYEFTDIFMEYIDDLCAGKDVGGISGDMYIKNCCHLICEVFKHSPVYRIGGDEFVAILTGQDYEERKRCVSELREAFDKAYSDTSLPAWERCSAAIGLAELSSEDNTLELVFKRADAAMYKDKKAFKQEHGSYR